MSDIDTENTIDIAELTARLGQPDHERHAVLAWTNTDRDDHLWTEREAAELEDIWAADTSRIERELG